MRISWIGIMAAVFLVSAKSSLSCEEELVRGGGIKTSALSAEPGRIFPSTVGGWILDGVKVSIYPFYFAGNLVYTVGRFGYGAGGKLAHRLGWAKSRPSLKQRRWSRELFPAFTFLALSFLNLTPGNLTADALMTDTLELFDPNVFENRPPDGVTVGANSVLSDSARVPVFDYLSGASLADNNVFFHTHVSNVKEWLAELVRVYRIQGSLKRAVFLGGGGLPQPGRVAIGDEYFDLAWVKRNQDLVDALPDDLFAEDAEIIFLNCHVGAQSLGSNVRQELVAAVQSFARKGATILASTRFSFGDPTGVPTEWASGQNPLLTKLELEVGYLLVVGLELQQLLKGDRITRGKKLLKLKVSRAL